MVCVILGGTGLSMHDFGLPLASVIPRPFRSVLAKIRSGNLPLNIETGRYSNPPIPLMERFCPFCCDKVETEIHFLCDCHIYGDLRDSLFYSVSQHSPTFIDLSSEEKFIYLMNCDNFQFYLRKTIIFKDLEKMTFL